MEWGSNRSLRESILDSLARKREEIMRRTSGRDTRGSLAKTREEIIANTGGQQTRESLAATRADIIGSLEAQRDAVFQGVRGDNPGPLSIPRESAPQTSEVTTLEAQLARERDPQRIALLQRQIEIVRQQAESDAAAQTGVQQAAQTHWTPYENTAMAQARLSRDSQMGQAAQQRAWLEAMARYGR